MRCDNVERGCDWQGTVEGLDDHVTKCGFTLVSCPDMCMIEHEESQMMRKDLNDHLKTKCLNRDYQCKHCGEKSTYASITEVHELAGLGVIPCSSLTPRSLMTKTKIYDTSWPTLCTSE